MSVHAWIKRKAAMSGAWYLRHGSNRSDLRYRQKNRMETHENIWICRWYSRAGETFGGGGKRLSWKRRRGHDRETDFQVLQEAEENSLQRACSIFCFPRTPTGAGNGREKRGKRNRKIVLESWWKQSSKRWPHRYGNLKEKVYVCYLYGDSDGRNSAVLNSDAGNGAVST